MHVSSNKHSIMYKNEVIDVDCSIYPEWFRVPAGTDPAGGGQPLKLHEEWKKNVLTNEPHFSDCNCYLDKLPYSHL